MPNAIVLIPAWAKDLDAGYNTINARAETAETIKELQALARPSRGFQDKLSAREASRLFVLRGRLHLHQLFVRSGSPDSV